MVGWPIHVPFPSETVENEKNRGGSSGIKLLGSTNAFLSRQYRQARFGWLRRISHVSAESLKSTLFTDTFTVIEKSEVAVIQTAAPQPDDAIYQRGRRFFLNGRIDNEGLVPPSLSGNQKKAGKQRAISDVISLNSDDEMLPPPAKLDFSVPPATKRTRAAGDASTKRRKVNPASTAETAISISSDSDNNIDVDKGRGSPAPRPTRATRAAAARGKGRTMKRKKTVTQTTPIVISPDPTPPPVPQVVRGHPRPRPTHVKMSQAASTGAQTKEPPQAPPGLIPSCTLSAAVDLAASLSDLPNPLPPSSVTAEPAKRAKTGQDIIDSFLPYGTSGATATLKPIAFTPGPILFAPGSQTSPPLHPASRPPSEALGSLPGTPPCTSHEPSVRLISRPGMLPPVAGGSVEIGRPPAGRSHTSRRPVLSIPEADEESTDYDSLAMTSATVDQSTR